MNYSYIRFIKNSIGAKKYRNLYMNEVDVLKNGRLSCAFFVSSVLFNFDKIKNVHATVKSTVMDMRDFGWRKISEENMKIGDVIIWEKKKQSNKHEHLHIGFYIGNKKAISNSWYRKSPWKHSYDYNGKRNILEILTFSS